MNAHCSFVAPAVIAVLAAKTQPRRSQDAASQWLQLLLNCRLVCNGWWTRSSGFLSGLTHDLRLQCQPFQNFVF